MMRNIPCIDIRRSSLVQLFSAHQNETVRIIAASRNSFGMPGRILSHAALPLGDYLARRWLHKTKNPYLHEIEQFARQLNIPGLFALNLCYEWGCTSGIYQAEEKNILAHVLDWPFSGLGESLVIARQQGSSGDFYNITWPGLSGIYQAMAPNRFTATLHQAPMRRYRGNIITDWLFNRVRFHQAGGLPPSHLLRKTLETAVDYSAAKQMLAEHPVSIPAIYVLGGVEKDEGCVIERLENTAVIREIGSQKNICATNHFESHLNGIGHGWMPRAINSNQRADHARNIKIDTEFQWFSQPIANRLSRLAMIASADPPTLQVMGTEGIVPVTSIFQLPQ